MKNKKYYKWIIGTLIISAVCPIFLLISEVKAIDIVTNVVPTGGFLTVGNSFQCLMENLNTGEVVLATKGNLGECSFRDKDSVSNLWVVRSVYISQPIKVKKGNYYSVVLSYQTEQLINNINWTQSVPNNGQWAITSIKPIAYERQSPFCMNYTPIQPSGSYYCGSTSGSSTLSMGIQNYEVTLLALQDNDSAYWYLGNPDGVPKSLFIPFSGAMTTTDIVEYKINSDIAEAEQKTEEQSNEGENNANQAEQTMEGASTNVIGVIGNVVGAFSTAPRNNCSLPMDLGNINFGNVDFCTGKPAVWQNMLGGAMSIVLVYAIYHIAKNVFNIFISAMAFAQGSGKGKTR